MSQAAFQILFLFSKCRSCSRVLFEHHPDNQQDDGNAVQHHRQLARDLPNQVARCTLCLFPQNGWLENSSNMAWGIIRNVPFVILGAVICWLCRKNKKKDRTFSLVWLYILLSFLFYIPVAVAAGIVPMLGMLMLPKTICYVLLIYAFLKAIKQKKSGPSESRRRFVRPAM